MPLHAPYAHSGYCRGKNMVGARVCMGRGVAGLPCMFTWNGRSRANRPAAAEECHFPCVALHSAFRCLLQQRIARHGRHTLQRKSPDLPSPRHTSLKLRLRPADGSSSYRQCTVLVCTVALALVHCGHGCIPCTLPKLTLSTNGPQEGRQLKQAMGGRTLTAAAAAWDSCHCRFRGRKLDHASVLLPVYIAIFQLPCKQHKACS